MFEAHQTGQFHISNAIQLFETGYIAFSVSTYENLKWGKYRTQIYFFSLIEKCFFTRHKKEVKELNAQELTWFNQFGATEIVKVPKIYKYCYICGRRLHYPVVPIKIEDNWVYQLRMCCSCYGSVLTGKISTDYVTQKAIRKIENYNLKDTTRTQKVARIKES